MLTAAAAALSMAFRFSGFAAISTNPAVNPTLTIAALAERAIRFIPAKVDARP
jgi:choline dehydrogenase-like flavoprotein